jgi:hypothetical protein
VRRVRFGAALASGIVLAIGSLTLLGLLVGPDLGVFSTLADVLALRQLSALFLRLAVVTAAVAVLVGFINLLLVHASRVARRQAGSPYSAVLLVTFIGAIVVRIGAPQVYTLLLEDVQVPIETALAMLVLVTLVLGAYRLLLRRFSWSRALFLAAVLVVLVGALPFAALAPVRAFSDLLVAIPATAGTRGILLGIALATLVAGVRILIGQDRSYRE